MDLCLVMQVLPVVHVLVFATSKDSEQAILDPCVHILPLTSAMTLGERSIPSRFLDFDESDRVTSDGDRRRFPFRFVDCLVDHLLSSSASFLIAYIKATALLNVQKDSNVPTYLQFGKPFFFCQVIIKLNLMLEPSSLTSPIFDNRW